MKHICLLITLFAISSSCGNKESLEKDNRVPVGMDLSFQPLISSTNFQYKNTKNKTIEMLPFLKDQGVDFVRIRLWHTPDNDLSSLTEVLNYAKEIVAADLSILLCIHYSDWWADPGNQTIPAAWAEHTAEQLTNAVYDYTKDVLQAFSDQNTLPFMVQIGNETNSGFLWDAGKVGGAFNDNWPTYIGMVDEGVRAVREVAPSTKIMLHFAGTEGSDWYYGNMQTVDYDVIGLSYYPIWHGKNLSVVQTSLNQLSADYNKEVMIVETAYPWTLGWNDWTNNIFGSEDQLIPEYAASPDGQRDFFQDLKNVVDNVPDNKGIGVCYWAPDWTAFLGSESTEGSSWENATIFDFDGKVLPIVEAFK